MKTTPLLLLVAAFGSFSFLIPSASAQDTVVTYQGRVQSNGTNFTGAGQFKFALVSTNAAVTATAIAFQIGEDFTGYTVTSGGSGYVTPPTVIISGGGGSGATATAVISGGGVVAINPVDVGIGYYFPPTVTIAPPPATILVTTYWSNDGTSSAGSEPGTAVSVPVANGLFTVGLGDTALVNMTALSAVLFQQTNLQLHLWFNNGVNGFAALSPVQNLTVAPYAAYAYAATTLTTANNQPLNFAINGNNVLRITTGYDQYGRLTANSVGGSSANVISNGFSGGFIGGGGNGDYPNRIGADYASVQGGLGNTASGQTSTAMGYGTTASDTASTAMGYGTTASGTASTAMGYGTTASGTASTAMGIFTSASGTYSTAMGIFTSASGWDSTAMGYRAKANHQSSFVWSDSQEIDFASTTNDQFLIRASGGVGINKNNPATALDVNGTVTATGFSGTGTGLTGLNAANLTGGTILDARLSSNVALRSGGNAFTGNQTITGGRVGIGTSNPQGTVHVYSTNNPTVVRIQSAGTPGLARLEFVSDPQGSANEWRPGYIQSTDNGSFVGGLAFCVNGAGGNKFADFEVMRIVNGRVGIGTNNPQSALHVVGQVLFSSGSGGVNQTVSWTPGSASWSFTSDRNVKDRVIPVSPGSVLEKVARIPINEWSYIGYDQRHIGPMAQDFHAQFPLNTNDKALNDADLHGVALAAIQGLNEKLETKSQKLEAENADLRTRLEKLERLLGANHGGAK